MGEIGVSAGRPRFVFSWMPKPQRTVRSIAVSVVYVTACIAALSFATIPVSTVAGYLPVFMYLQYLQAVRLP